MTRIVTTHYRYKPRAPRYKCLAIVGICGMLDFAVMGPAGADNRFDGVYTGKRVLTKAFSPTCLTEDEVSVTIHGNELRFTHSRLHDFPISFDLHPDGSFSQISDVGGHDVLIQGRVIGDVIEADVADPECKYHWHLKRSQ